jgi:hypothetical protein
MPTSMAIAQISDQAARFDVAVRRLKLRAAFRDMGRGVGRQ